MSVSIKKIGGWARTAPTVGPVDEVYAHCLE